MATKTARILILKLHLWLGLSAAAFLTILGVSGAIIAFENDIDHWVHPGLWYVHQQPPALLEEELIRLAQLHSAPALVTAIRISRQSNLAQLMDLNDGSKVFINPYNGVVQGRTAGPSNVDKTLGYIHQIHLRLVPDPKRSPKLAEIGKQVVSYAGLILCLMVPTGLLLWWRTKRFSFHGRGSWFRLCFDAHHAIGVSASLFLFAAAATGVLIGFDWGEKAIFSITKSSRPAPLELPASTPSGSVRIPIDQAMQAARRALPDATIAGIFMPHGPAGSINFLMRVPEETSESVHSFVSVDQFSGKVLLVRDFRTDSLGYRVIRFNRSLHTGDVLGTPTHVLMATCSILLVVMVITGCVIWWKKLAI